VIEVSLPKQPVNKKNDSARQGYSSLNLSEVLRDLVMTVFRIMLIVKSHEPTNDDEDDGD
jgi:hypothetical protein